MLKVALGWLIMFHDTEELEEVIRELCGSGNQKQS
jgi:hypothetical protein